MIREYSYLLMLVLNEEELGKLCKLPNIRTNDRKYLCEFRNEVIDMNKSVDYEMWKERYHIYKWGLQKEKEEWGEEIEYRTKIKNAKKMLIDNITPELVVKYTELPLKEVLKIKKSLIKL